MRRLSLLAQFSILSFVLLSAFGVVLGYGLTRLFETQEIGRQTDITASLLSPAITPYLNEQILTHGAYGKDYKNIEAAFSYLGGADLVRVKIWNADGLVVYSDQPTLVGTKFPVSAELQQTLNGATTAEISKLTKDENVNERGFGELMEVYTPVILPTESAIAGAFEGYYNIDDLRNTLDQTNRFLWSSIAGGFLALYLSLFAIVRSASQRLTRQSRENTRLLADTERKAARLATINELSRAINQSSLDLPSVFQTALRGVDRIVPNSAACIIVLNEHTGEEVRRVLLESPDIAHQELLSIDIAAQRRLLALGDDDMALCMDCRRVKAPEIVEVMKRGIRSFLLLNIRLGSRMLGTLLVVSPEAGAIDEDDGAILKGVADQLAVAIENTRLIRETAETTALRETNRLKDEFVSMVSHELRTPLASIKGYSSTLMSSDGVEWDEITRLEFLSIIADESDKLTDLVENLLEMSRIEAGRLPITPEPVLLSRFCRKVADRVAKHYPEIAFHCALHDPLPVVEADPRRMEQVLLNLLQNAAKYSGSHEVWIQGEYNGGSEVVISVEDHGKGIEPEHLPFLFDKFYRGEPGSAGKSGGTGLGLAICKALVEAQGGRIWVESTPGVVTKFSFTLPTLVLPDDGGVIPKSSRELAGNTAP